VLNARIRKAWTKGAQVGLIGEAVDLTYDYKHMGTDRAALVELVGPKPTAKPETGVVIVGQGAINEADGEAVLSQAMKPIAEARAPSFWCCTRRLAASARWTWAPDRRRAVGGDRGAQVIYNLGADEVEISRDGSDAPFVIYQGSHGDRGANRADIILPGAAYTEENGPVRQHRGAAATGLPRRLRAGRGQGELGHPAGAVGRTGRHLPWDSLAGLRKALVAAHPHLGRIDEVAANDWQALP
jgi:NADH-quinone oxidoreductase subunit G